MSDTHEDRLSHIGELIAVILTSDELTQFVETIALSQRRDAGLNEEGPANVVHGLFAIAQSLDSVASAIRYLGNGEAATSMGAIENLSKELRDGLVLIAAAVESTGR